MSDRVEAERKRAHKAWLKKRMTELDASVARIKAGCTKVPLMEWETQAMIRLERDMLREQVKNLQIELEVRRGPKPKRVRVEDKRKAQGRCVRCAEKKPHDGKVTCAECLAVLRIKYKGE